MKWEAHQRNGFFGFTLQARGKTLEAVPGRWEVKVDLHEAMAEVGDIFEAWLASRAWPNVPPFSGGMLDAWPNRLREGLAVCREEWAAVMAYVRWLSKGGK